MSTFVTQPSATNDTGVVLSVGIFSNGQRSAIVLPIFTDSAIIPPSEICTDAVGAFADGALTNLLACLSSDAYVSHIAAESMIDGLTPFRSDYGPTTFPGTAPAVTLPNSVAGMIFFYQDPADYVSGRTRVAKNSIPAPPADYVLQDSLTTTYRAALELFADDVQNGFASIVDASKKWYRGLRAPKPRTPGTHVARTFVHGSRGYVVTQRRRLTPR